MVRASFLSGGKFRIEGTLIKENILTAWIRIKDGDKIKHVKVHKLKHKVNIG